jgi:uncharacterized membrane protein (DUF485 family)
MFKRWKELSKKRKIVCVAIAVVFLVSIFEGNYIIPILAIGFFAAWFLIARLPRHTKSKVIKVLIYTALVVAGLVAILLAINGIDSWWATRRVKPILQPTTDSRNMLVWTSISDPKDTLLFVSKGKWDLGSQGEWEFDKDSVVRCNCWPSSHYAQKLGCECNPSNPASYTVKSMPNAYGEVVFTFNVPNPFTAGQTMKVPYDFVLHAEGSGAVPVLTDWFCWDARDCDRSKDGCKYAMQECQNYPSFTTFDATGVWYSKSADLMGGY